MSEGDTPSVPARPTASQLRNHFLSCAVPMVGFGFMDNTVMLHAGNAIDLTVGVTLGLSTLAAAACGQICSDVAGVSFGGLIEAAAGRLGLPSPDFTEAQRHTALVKNVGLLGSVAGVITGCSLGLLNLLLIDAEQAGELKMAAASSAMGFSVHLSNTIKEGQTVLVVEGPESIDGVIAAITTAIAASSCRIQEMDGHRGHREEDRDDVSLHFRFCLTKDGKQVDDDALEALGRAVMKGCNNPERIQTLSVANEELRRKNDELTWRLSQMQASLEAHLLTIHKKRSEELYRSNSSVRKDCQTSLEE